MTQLYADKTPVAIARQLGRLRRSLRGWLVIDGLSRVAMWLAILVVVDLGIDRLLRMDRAQRTIMWLGMAAVIGVVVWRRLVGPLRRGLSDDALAARVEARHPELHQQMISALQLARMEDAAQTGASPQLVQATIDGGNRAAEGVQFTEVVNRRKRGQNVMRGAAAVAVLAGLALAMPGTMALWWQRNVMLSDAQWPVKTHLKIVGEADGRLVAARGDDVAVLVKAEGVLPNSVTLDYRPAGGRRQSQTMNRVGRDGYRLTLRNVLEEAKLRARGGDGQTSWITLGLVERPAVEELRLFYTPPAYIGTEPRELEAGQGSYYIPAGSTLRISGRANKPLSAAQLLKGDAVIGPLARPAEDDRAFGGTIDPADLASGTYGIALTDTNQPVALDARQPVRFSVRVVEDQKPGVRAQLEGIGDMVVARAVVPITCRFSDDYAITAASLTWRQQTLEGEGGGGELAFDELAGEYGKPRIGPYEYRLELEPLKLTENEHLTFRITAQDNDTLHGPNAGESTLFSVKVVSEEELRTELLRREQEQRLEFERLLKDQQELLVGTRALAAGLDDAEKLNAAQRRELDGLERRQRLAAGRCGGIAKQFDRILAEVVNNRLEEADGPMHRRLESKITQPLRALAEREIALAADGLDGAGKVPPAERAGVLEATIAHQRELVSMMRKILAAMVKLEGYQEAINVLREILKQQKDVRAETVKELEKRISDIFED
jgi:hypothetical protein